MKEKLGVNQPRFEQKTRQEPMPKDGIRPAPPLATKKKDIIKGLCIVVDFSDEQSYYTLPELDSMMNGKNFTSYGLNGSVYQYFNDVSGGVVEFNNVIYGIFRAPKTFAEYDAMSMGVGVREILQLALESMDKEGFDFSTLSHDSSGYIRSITLLYPGSPSSGMWYHQYWHNGFKADGVQSNTYCTSDANMSLRRLCHENGHQLFHWPDMYQYRSGICGTIGSFDLMASGGDDYNPVPPNPYFMLKEGWATATEVNNYTGTITDTANDLHFYKYTNPLNPKEYYLFNAVQNTGRSEYLPDEGLSIWKIIENGNNQSDGSWMVRLIHADNGCNYNGMCWKPGLNTEYSDTSVPGAKWEEGIILSNIKTGLRCWNVSAPGAVITYQFNNYVCPPSPVETYVKLASGKLEKNNIIGVCLGSDDFTLSPLPNTSTGWTWLETDIYRLNVDTISKSREVPVSGTKEVYYQDIRSITAYFEAPNGCFYRADYTINYRTSPQATAFVETENSDWIQKPTVRVCAGGLCNLRAEV
ncbi:MAG: M6 family metalloprotease domain-containing protein [Bacteroidales bacterium]|nr:M6 family metalloprotease domain-containing protein [Bacteroidales bacterium]